MNSVFTNDGLNFSCSQCSDCCRIDPGVVFLSENDLATLLRWSLMTKDDFITVYCRWVCHSDGYEYLCLKEKSNYDCILWKNGCIAYEFRPLQCSTFPFWSHIVNDKKEWQAMAHSCPGIGKGKFHSTYEIEKLLKEQEQNPSIRRKIATVQD